MEGSREEAMLYFTASMNAANGADEEKYNQQQQQQRKKENRTEIEKC